MPTTFPLSPEALHSAGLRGLVLIAELVADGGYGIGSTLLVSIVAIGRHLIQSGS